MKIVIGGDISIAVDNERAKAAFANKRTEELFDEGVQKLFRSADERIVNLECAVTDKNTPIKKFGPNLNAPFGTGDTLRQLGVTLCAVSNNHIFDFGKAGTKDTFAELERCGLPYTGYGKNSADARKDYVIEKEGKKVAVITVCEHEYSYALESREGAREYDPYDTSDDIVNAKKTADYVIVIYHGGKEYCRYPSPRLLKLCRSMIRHGADVVLCQHSHCIGCYEKFEGGHIVYGQGNFHFAWDMPTEEKQRMWYTGLAAVVEIDENSLQFSVEPVVMKGIRLCLANSQEKQIILNELKERSRCLADGSWQEKWKAFCDSVPYYTDAIQELNIERLKEIADAVSVPLVLHGGSGLSDDDFKNTIREGIAKVNIFTDLCLAGERAMKDGAEKKLGYLETRNMKVEYIKEAVKHKMSLFGSVNKA